MNADYLALANRLADAAGEVIRRYFRCDYAVESKADATPVTRADCEAEAAMRALLSATCPDHGILGEEAGGEKLDAEYVWALDPIDGTSAFLCGRPIFGTLIALLRHGRPILGVIDQPITRERWAAAGGTQQPASGNAYHSRACPSLADAVFCTTSPYLFAAKERAAFERLRGKARHVVFGGDCYNYAMLAAGQVDLVVESGLKPYDYLALAPVIERAGGVITDWQGEPLTLHSDGRVLAAGDARLHREAMALLHGE